MKCFTTVVASRVIVVLMAEMGTVELALSRLEQKTVVIVVNDFEKIFDRTFGHISSANSHLNIHNI